MNVEGTALGHGTVESAAVPQSTQRGHERRRSHWQRATDPLLDAAEATEGEQGRLDADQGRGGIVSRTTQR